MGGTTIDGESGTAVFGVPEFREVMTVETVLSAACEVCQDKDKEAYSSLCYKHRTATGTHVPYGITQCYPYGT